MKEQYRFDDSYEVVYTLEGGDYMYLCNYFSVDINVCDPAAVKLHKVRKWEDPELAAYEASLASRA